MNLSQKNSPQKQRLRHLGILLEWDICPSQRQFTASTQNT